MPRLPIYSDVAWAGRPNRPDLGDGFFYDVATDLAAIGLRRAFFVYGADANDWLAGGDRRAALAARVVAAAPEMIFLDTEPVDGPAWDASPANPDWAAAVAGNAALLAWLADLLPGVPLGKWNQVPPDPAARPAVGASPAFEAAVAAAIYPRCSVSASEHYEPVGPPMRESMRWFKAQADRYSMRWVPTFRPRGSSAADMADRLAVAAAEGADAAIVWPDVARRADAGGRPLVDYLATRAPGAARTADATILDLCAALRVARGLI
jgi:hypothetical protein